ncbi:MAG: regulatory protein RecX [SAR324 cluster bacterium]|nr:regulatory protein RecX [SAR324 cluster bacterium]
MTHQEVFIVELRKKSANMMLLLLNDGDSLLISEKKVNDLGLTLQSSLSVETVFQLKEDQIYSAIYRKAMEFLAVREHSSRELFQKLTARFQETHLIEKCLQHLKQHAFQSDERYAEAFISSRLTRKDCGSYMILAEAQQKGISKEVAEKLLKEQADDDLWLEKAKNYLEWIKKTSKNLSYQKQWNKLYTRGFSREIIHQVLNES